MTAAVAQPLRHMARRVKSWLGSRVVVLLYHRIGDAAAGAQCDPHRIRVSPELFAEQMSLLRKAGDVMRLDELAEALENRKVPRRGIVVTFDDGYIDNLYTARPILERHDVPATVFMTGGQIGREREFWWDELARLLLEAGDLPAELRLKLGDATEHRWQLDGVERFSDDDARRHADWDFESFQVPPTPRHKAYKAIYPLLWDLSDADRRPLLDELLKQAGRSSVVRETHRAMNDEEICRLGASNGLVEVGAHTMTHPNLAAQPLAAQRDEITGSKRRLEEVLGRPVQSFAYPFGLHTAETVGLVQEAGFARACACMGHAVRQSSEMFRLTRTDLGNLGGDLFEKKLQEAFAS